MLQGGAIIKTTIIKTIIAKTIITKTTIIKTTIAKPTDTKPTDKEWIPQNLHRCHLDFANAIVALRRMAQFSASSQIGFFQPSPRAMKPLPLLHSARQAKMLTKAAGCQKAVNRP